MGVTPRTHAITVSCGRSPGLAYVISGKYPAAPVIREAGSGLKKLNDFSAIPCYSLLSASMGSILDARHAGYSPEITHTIIPISIPAGT